jgi:hypothetical protein
LRTEKISDEMAKTLADGFGVLVEVLKALGTRGEGARRAPPDLDMGTGVTQER